MLTDTDVHAVATEVFEAALGTDRFERLDVEHRLDHDGEPAFFVTLRLKPGADPQDVATSSSAHAALRRRLLELDEERFPYLRYRYPNDEILAGEDESEAT